MSKTSVSAAVTEAAKANIKKAQSKASSPEARAKAVATLKAKREAEKAAGGSGVLPQHTPAARAKAEATRKRNRRLKKKLPQVQEVSLDAIPDRPPKTMKQLYEKHKKKEARGYWISEADWLILRMAKMMLREEK
jgi:hypothetical protein